jgi:hypothetical protein
MNLAYRCKSLLAVPLRDRRELLRTRAEASLGRRPVSASLATSVYNLIRAAKAQGLEGIIAKRGPVRTTRQVIFAPQQLVVALAYENEDDFIRNLVVMSIASAIAFLSR